MEVWDYISIYGGSRPLLSAQVFQFPLAIWHLAKDYFLNYKE